MVGSKRFNLAIEQLKSMDKTKVILENRSCARKEALIKSGLSKKRKKEMLEFIKEEKTVKLENTAHEQSSEHCDSCIKLDNENMLLKEKIKQMQQEIESISYNMQSSILTNDQLSIDLTPVPSLVYSKQNIEVLLSKIMSKVKSSMCKPTDPVKSGFVEDNEEEVIKSIVNYLKKEQKHGNKEL